MSEEKPSRWSQLKIPAIKMAILVVLIVVFILISHYPPVRELINKARQHPEQIKTYIQNLGALGALVYVGIFGVGLTINLPGIIFIFLAGYLYGTFLGGILAFSGAMLGVTLSFAISRYLGRDFVALTIPEGIRRWEPKLKEKGFFAIIILRIFLFLNPALNWAMGLTAISFKNYFLGSAVALLPLVYFWCWVVDVLPAKYSIGVLVGVGALFAVISRLFARKKPQTESVAS